MSARGPTSKKILHVEDNPENRLLVRALLEAEGYEVVDAEDGLTGIEAAISGKPDLVLLDINLPVVSGYEVGLALKVAVPDIPIVAVTAYAMEGDRERTLVAGCDGYIQKPIDADAFARQVGEFLRGKRERLAAGEESAHLRELNQHLVYRLVDHIQELKRLNRQFARRASQLEALHLAVQDITPEAGAARCLDRLLPALARALATTTLTVELADGSATRLTVEGEGAVERGEGGTELEWRVPIALHGKTLGSMLARQIVPPRAASDEEQLLKIVANQLAIAIENARLYEDLQERLRQTQTLLAVSQTAGATLDSTEVARRTVRELVRALGADFGGAYRRDPDDGRFVPMAGYRVPRDLLAKLSEPGSGEQPILRAALTTGGPLYASDSQADGRFKGGRLLDALPHRSILIVPMIAKDEVMGGFVLVWLREMHVFGEEELGLAQGIARQAAIALENGRLFAELQAALKAIEESQQRIVQGERLRALGEMAGGVAHDFNNTLAIIIGRAEVLLSDTEDLEAQRQLNVIIKVALDAAQTVKRIQEFTRMRRARPFHQVDLNQIVEEVVEVSRSRWKDDAQGRGVRYDVLVEASPLGPVAGDPAELRDALTNIVFNALDAMPEGGSVTLRTTVEHGRAVCAVTDTGIGMTDEVRQRIFDPFFTTKGERGTGLGLSVVYGIVTRHGGELDVVSRPGHGSTFTVRLPLGGEPRSDGSAKPAAQASRPVSVLVIDDEKEVAEVLRDLLARDGHRVVICGDGESGLARFQTDTFEFVITDLGMPGLSGWDVARLIKLWKPGTPVAMVTGWGDRIDPAEAEARGVDYLVNKPFKRDHVRDLVARVLTRGETSGSPPEPPGPDRPRGAR
ncbi:MAG: response regulator [Candidatus Rokubacteria bacterium]|nr:response regulator [Candidatus Rokubacteria bacterium]MBI3826019.1 response regulator [Candidatus Rokubacteria bacterium]